MKKAPPTPLLRSERAGGNIPVFLCSPAFLIVAISFERGPNSMFFLAFYGSDDMTDTAQIIINTCSRVAKDLPVHEEPRRPFLFVMLQAV